MSRSQLSSRAEEQVLLGLGGNIGDPLASMRAALQALDGHPQCRVAKVSSIWRTPPWGVIDQPDFLNACADIRTDLEPRAFLDLCLSIEQDLKRVRDVRWGPRSIDMDILFFTDRNISQSGLIVPHPRLADRAFVLVPLAEIAPERMHRGNSIAELARLSDQSGMTMQQGPGWF
jgi:2-amino-4-hydroxy-6-hydroxymethyldihydropteridine diphosphokinase